MPSHHPVLEDLSLEDCYRLLKEGSVGRIAISVGAMPAILPVNYAMLDGDIVFRTAPGSKLTAAVLGAVVAFEIDHTDPVDHTGWSVLAVGLAAEVTDGELLERVTDLELEPWTDGSRDHVVLIKVGHLSGRRVRRVLDNGASNGYGWS